MTHHIWRAALLIICLQGSLCYAGGKAHHFPGLFLGATHVDKATNPSYGLEYEYKLRQWGLGWVFEHTPGAHHNDGMSVGLVSLYFHPDPSVRLGFGLGKERIGGDHPHQQSLWRLSASYDFHIGHYGIAPAIAVDRIKDKSAVVAGLAFIYPF